MQIKIFVVCNEDLTQRLNEAIKLEDIKTKLVKLFGGLTESKPLNKGYWMNENNEIEHDCVKTWEILTYSKAFNAYLSEFERLMLQIKQITNQKSQLYTINPQVEAIFL